ncbi:MAG: potassium channel family protein [Acidimicrobiales bacterium]|jgi:hypothetical protein|nr:potassium channel family protein [Acidimicrobiales bacterium]
MTPPDTSSPDDPPPPEPAPDRRGDARDGSGSTTSERLTGLRPDLDRRARNRLLLKVALRIAATTAVLIAIYALLPLSADGKTPGALVLFAGVAAIVVVTVRQIERILVSPHPIASGAEAVATILPMFIVVFAYVYVWLSSSDPQAFSQPVGRVDGIYFVVTVLSTVGFGDITPVSTQARMIVTAQMILGLVLIGFVARLVVNASQVGLQRRREEIAAERRGRTGDGPAPSPPGPAPQPER